MGIRWEGNQRGRCGLVHACAEGPSEELARIWSQPGDLLLGPRLRRQLGRAEVLPEDTLDFDMGRNIQAMHRVIRGRREDLLWLVELHEIELQRGLEGRDLMSGLYSADNIVTAILTYQTLGVGGWHGGAPAEPVDILRRWVRARLTLAALMAAPHRVTRTTWTQPPGGARDFARGEHWRQGPSVLRAGSRVNAQIVLQEPMSDLLCAAIEYPGWRDERLFERSMAPGHPPVAYPRHPGDDHPPGWQPSYLDPAMALWQLSQRLGGISFADTCGLTEEERYCLRHVVGARPFCDGNEEEAAYAVANYLAGIPCHSGFRAIHFLRDESSCAVVIESNASRNKPTATVSVARWRPGGWCAMDTFVPAPFRGTGAADVASSIRRDPAGQPWADTWRVEDDEGWYDIPIPRGDVWHYRWTAGWERVGSAEPIAPPPPKPPPPPEPKPPKPRPPRGWWRRLLGWLRSLT